MVDELLTANQELRAIVLALAAQKPNCNAMGSECHFCGENDWDPDGAIVRQPHLADCLWVKAKKILERDTTPQEKLPGPYGRAGI